MIVCALFHLVSLLSHDSTILSPPIVGFKTHHSMSSYDCASNILKFGESQRMPKNLEHALRVEDFKQLQKLIENGIDVNCVNQRGDTALIIICRRYSVTIAPVEYHEKPNYISWVETAIWLIEHGANVNIEDKINGSTPLLYACEAHSYDLVNQLLMHKADIGATNLFKQSPLVTALQVPLMGSTTVRMIPKEDANLIKLVTLLLRYGVSINAEDCFGGRALDYALESQYKQIIDLLHKKGAKRGTGHQTLRRDGSHIPISKSL